MVQLVHSLSHVGSTVADYGPLSSFTTFNFENELGKLNTNYIRRRYPCLLCYVGLMTRTCKSIRRHPLEIIDNLAILREAHYHLMDPDMDSNLLPVIGAWVSGYSCCDNDQSIYKVMHRLKQNDRIVRLVFHIHAQSYFTQQHTCTLSVFGSQHGAMLAESPQMTPAFFSSLGKKSYSAESQAYSCGMTIVNRCLEYRFCRIESLLSITSMMTRWMNLLGIQTGELNDGNYLIIRAADILEKCVSFQHVTVKTFTIMNFPNLTESS